MNNTATSGFKTLVKTDVMPITMKGIRSISETPYGTLGNALSELIDNSWEKGYGTTFTDIISVYENKPFGKLKMVKVVDNGPGMDSKTLEQCCMIGSETEKGAETLGLYGIGQKSACLWMADQYEILTKREDGPLLSATFNYDEGLHICELNNEKAYRAFKSLTRADHGTVVVLSKVKLSRFPKRKSTFTENVRMSHGLTYSEKIKNGATMFVNGEKITPVHFVNEEISTLLSEENSIFKFKDGKGNVHEIPYQAWFTPSDKEGDKRTDVLGRTIENQGFVCVRNGRVVGYGQLFDVMRARNPIYNGLKIILHLDGSLDSYFGISFGKTQRGQIMNDDFRDQFVKEFKHYFALAKKYQNQAIEKGETTEDFDKAVADIQQEILNNKEIQDILNEYKCNAERDADDGNENNDKPKDDNTKEPPKPKEPKEPKDEDEKKHRNPRNGGKMKICGRTFVFTIEERGVESPYFTPEVDEKGVCKCVINSSHNYFKNYLHGLNRMTLKHPIKLMFAEWLSVFGKGEPEEDELMTYMRGLQSRSDELQKLYKENIEEVYEEFDETV
jgi:hypothetical protein